MSVIGLLTYHYSLANLVEKYPGASIRAGASITMNTAHQNSQHLACKVNLAYYMKFGSSYVSEDCDKTTFMICWTQFSSCKKKS